jgi:hypothetical protein
LIIDHTAIARRFTLVAIVAAWLQPNFCLALPPAEDIPEEILRTEIILEGRSIINGKPLSAAEYESQKAQLAQTRFHPQLDPDIQQTIFLLQIRKFIKTVIPFY